MLFCRHRSVKRAASGKQRKCQRNWCCSYRPGNNDNDYEQPGRRGYVVKMDQSPGVAAGHQTFCRKLWMEFMVLCFCVTYTCSHFLSALHSKRFGSRYSSVPSWASGGITKFLRHSCPGLETAQKEFLRLDDLYTAIYRCVFCLFTWSVSI